VVTGATGIYFINTGYDGNASQGGLGNLLQSDGCRLYYGKVASCRERISEHIERHELPINPQTYLLIASFASGEGTHYISYSGEIYGVCIRGDVEFEGKKYYLVRSIIRHGEDTGGLVDRLRSEQNGNNHNSKSQINRRLRQLIRAAAIP
jgi:hypothetical protein